MQKIILYSKGYCSYCDRAKELLNIKGAKFIEIDVTYDAEREQEMRQRSGQRTVPQIFIGNRHIGGCSELFALDEKGGLDPLLTSCTESG